MTTNYKILIVITFLIVCFFFAKWVNDVWPRYEIRERIVEVNYCFTQIQNGDCYVAGNNFNSDGSQIYDRTEVEYWFCPNTDFDGDGEGICYIKEKVRIN